MRSASAKLVEEGVEAETEDEDKEGGGDEVGVERIVTRILITTGSTAARAGRKGSMAIEGGGEDEDAWEEEEEEEEGVAWAEWESGDGGEEGEGGDGTCSSAREDVATAVSEELLLLLMVDVVEVEGGLATTVEDDMRGLLSPLLD